MMCKININYTVHCTCTISVPGAVKKKFSRGANSPDLPRWESEEDLEYNANLV